ncbi:MAG: hypothetical protein J6K76_03605 [Spirochaetaceae bacterium]|nr:hypothetical protein [Spirochaetaceae bacterium]
MKKDVFFTIIIVLMVCSCNIEKLAFQQPQTQNLNISHIQPYMVEGAELSAERPAPHLLSQQEVMIRAAEYAVQQGYLDPAHPIYEEVPELATAKVAEPIFVCYENELQQGKVNGFYNIYTTTANGTTKIEARVFAQEIIPGGTDNPTFGITYNQFILSKYIITKKESKSIYQNLFPGKDVSNPMAISIKTSVTPFFVSAWYVEVSDGSRSAGGSHEEYLLDMTVFDLPPQQSISANPRAALSRSTVSGGWGTRIARIDEPLHLHEKLAQAKARAAAGEPEPAVGPTEPVKITPVEF